MTCTATLERKFDPSQLSTHVCYRLLVLVAINLWSNNVSVRTTKATHEYAESGQKLVPESCDFESLDDVRDARDSIVVNDLYARKPSVVACAFVGYPSSSCEE